MRRITLQQFFPKYVLQHLGMPDNSQGPGLSGTAILARSRYHISCMILGVPTATLSFSGMVP